MDDAPIKDITIAASNCGQVYTGASMPEKKIDQPSVEAEETHYCIPCEVPEGFMPVRVGLPKKGELFVYKYGAVLEASADYTQDTRLIVRRKEPVWPELAWVV